MGKLDTLYARGPVPLQNLMVSGYGVYWHWARFGRGFARLASEFGERESFSQSEWARYQEEQFRRLVRVCAAEVPYYASLWTDAQKKSAALSDLQNLPLLEKKPLRENPYHFLRQDLRPIPRFRFFTSGTTGTPISSFFTLEENRKCMALREARSANWAGVSFF